jgi:predicted AlkP superfamily pyrophosphatase or phosphodiesterase
MLRKKIFILILVFLAGIPRDLAAREIRPPRLAVIIVIDGLSYEQMMNYRTQYGPDGFNWLMLNGALFTQASYGYADTSTSSGHATLMTGAQPNEHGVISNEWFDPQSESEIYSTEDPAHHYLDEPTDKYEGTSPRNLALPTLGDQLRLATNKKAKVLALSIKDRAAILLAGKSGTAYFFSPLTGRFITSSYYQKDYPDWLKNYHLTRVQDKWFDSDWIPLLPLEAHQGSGPDDQPYYTDFLFLGKKFPHKITGGLKKPGPQYYQALSRTPYADEYLLDFSIRTIKNENLGKNPGDVPDMIALSFSSHDYINHLFGPGSIQSHDHLLRLDKMLAQFLKFLDSWIGLRQTLIVLTSDHGFSEAPERCEEKGRPAGRIDSSAMLKALNEHLAAKFGPGDYVRHWSHPRIYLNQKLIRGKRLNPLELEKKAGIFLSQYPGVASIFVKSDLIQRRFSREFERQVWRSWNAKTGGDLYVLQKPCWYLVNEPNQFASHHGSPYEYDTRVPLIFFGSGFKRGRYDRPVDMAQVAPTILYALRIQRPEQNRLQVINEILSN